MTRKLGKLLILSMTHNYNYKVMIKQVQSVNRPKIKRKPGSRIISRSQKKVVKDAEIKDWMLAKREQLEPFESIKV